MRFYRDSMRFYGVVYIGLWDLVGFNDRIPKENDQLCGLVLRVGNRRKSAISDG